MTKTVPHTDFRMQLHHFLDVLMSYVKVMSSTVTVIFL